MRHMVAESPLRRDVTVDSVGVHGYHVGDPPDVRAVAAAVDRGYSVEGITARRITRRDFEKADLFLAMDYGHLRRMKTLQESVGGQKKAAIKLLASFGTGTEKEVPDPYYGSDADFAFAIEMIEDGCRGLLDRLINARQSALETSIGES